MTKRAPQSLREMDTKHLACRNFMHPWDPVRTEVSTFERRKVWIIYLRCLRCKAKTRELYFPLSRERKRYVPTYPAGYLVEGLQKEWGGRKLLNENVRDEYFTRIVNNGRR
jgi:hypothetical protein